MDPGAIALRGGLWWLLLPLIGLPVSLYMSRRGQPGFLARLLVWFVIIPLFLGAAFLGRWVFCALLGACGAVALWEIARLEDGSVRRAPVLAIGLLLAAGGPVAAAVYEPFPWQIAIAAWLIGPLLYFVLPRRNGGNARVLALALYLGAGLAAWPRLLALPVGFRFVLVAFSVVIVADILAFTCGRLFPRQSLFLRLSSGKTTAGYVGGGLAAVGAAFILWYAMPELSGGQVVAAALVLAVSGAAGDLLASGIKRRHGVKDSGRTLGRMGGMLDRLDSLLTAGWVFFLYLWLVR